VFAVGVRPERCGVVVAIVATLARAARCHHARLARLTGTVLLAAAIFWSGTAFGFDRAGTAAAQFLKIGVGARAWAMGGAFAAVADDPTALYWNPAGAVQLTGWNLAGHHALWFADLSHDYVGVVAPLGSSGSLGGSATFLSTDEIEITTELEEEGTGEYFSAQDICVGVTYARWLTDRFAAGVTGKYIQQNLHNESASAVAIDAGTLLRTGLFGARIGMSMSNFGGRMQLEGRDLSVSSTVVVEDDSLDSHLETGSWPLPLNFRVGIAVDLIGPRPSVMERESSRLTLAVDANHPNDNEERASIGAEYVWQEVVALRAGYRINYDEESYTLGGGIRVPVANRSLQVDYAFAEFGRLEDIHIVTLSVGI